MASTSVQGVAGISDDNIVRLVGRITTAPERRSLPSGDEVVSLRIVVRRPDGIVDTVPVQVGPAPGAGRRAGPGQVGRRSLSAAERLSTGTRVRVEGRLRRRWWQAGGARRSMLEVNASVIAPVSEPADADADADADPDVDPGADHDTDPDADHRTGRS